MRIAIRKRAAEKHQWHPWFAWYPVRVLDTETYGRVWVWLEKVERIYVYGWEWKQVWHRIPAKGIVAKMRQV